MRLGDKKAYEEPSAEFEQFNFAQSITTSFPSQDEYGGEIEW